MTIRGRDDTRMASGARDDGAGLLYLYGIVAAESDAHRLIESGRVAGIEPDQPLFPIEAGGLVAAVSRVSAVTFDEPSLNALITDLPRLTPLAVRHEEAVRAMLGSAMIPMAFGTVYRSVESVQAMVRDRAGEFRRLLGWLSGREEWGIKIVADLAAVRRAAEAESATLRSLAEEEAAATPGRAYLLARRREQMLDAESSRLVEGMLTEIVHQLVRSSESMIQDDPGPPQPGMEQLVFKGALLVDSDRADELCAAAVELDRAHAARGLRIETSGPWAPYSFVRGTRDADA
jgi:hypothetical protein